MAGPGNPPIPTAIASDPHHSACASRRRSQPCLTAAALGNASQATTKRVGHPGNRSSTTIYSGMVPGLIAGLYSRDQVAIDLRLLAKEAGVAFVQAEIKGIDLTSQTCSSRPCRPTQLSLDVGAISHPIAPNQLQAVWFQSAPGASAGFLEQPGSAPRLLSCGGIGSCRVEVALALRRRWPRRSIHVLARINLDRRLAKALRRQKCMSSISQQRSSNLPSSISAGLICGGSARLAGSLMACPVARERPRSPTICSG